MGKVLFAGLAFDSEHDRNRYVYKHLIIIKVIDEKKVKDEIADPYEGFAGLGGLLFGYVIGAIVAVVILLISASQIGLLLAVLAFFGLPLYFNSRAIRKNRQDSQKRAREKGEILPTEASVATQKNLSQYYGQYEDFLKSMNSSVVWNIFDKFMARYPTWEEQHEHYGDVANLVKIKTNIYVSGEDIDLLLKIHKENKKLSLINARVQLMMSELSKSGEKTLQNVAAAFVKIFYIDYLDDPYGEEEVYPIYAGNLSKEGLSFSVAEIGEAVDRQRSLQVAQDFELKLNTTYSGNTESILEEANPYEFERLVSHIFLKAGYNTEVTKKSGDQGADIIIEKDGISTAVQAKKYAGSVGNKAVQEVVASKKFYDCDRAMVVTTGEFTKGARELAQRNGVELVDRRKLLELIKSTS